MNQIRISSNLPQGLFSTNIDLFNDKYLPTSFQIVLQQIRVRFAQQTFTILRKYQTTYTYLNSHFPHKPVSFVNRCL